MSNYECDYCEDTGVIIEVCCGTEEKAARNLCGCRGGEEEACPFCNNEGEE